MSKIFKNSICLLLVSLFIFGALSPKHASGTESAIEPVLDDYRITEEIATFIAEFFVQDYEAYHETAWTNETSVSNVITLYDVDKLPVAYSVELTTNGIDSGYVVISAYSDVENIILEFADEARPLYDEFDNWDEDNIVVQLNRGVPFFLETINHSFYNNGKGRHGVAAYAFTRLKRKSDGAFKSYVKIADGWGDKGRFIDIATINSSTSGRMISWSR